MTLFKKFLIYFLTFCCVSWVYAQSNEETWQKNISALSKIRTWNLYGSVAVRTPKDSLSANIQWQENRGNYSLFLYGPMASGSLQLLGKPGRVQLNMSNGKSAVADSAETLLLQQAGWNFPVSFLKYWIRGMPVPQILAEKKFYSDGRIMELRQQGWVIQYLSYTSVKNIDIPNKVAIFYPQLNIKIFINRWRF